MWDTENALKASASTWAAATLRNKELWVYSPSYKATTAFCWIQRKFSMGNLLHFVAKFDVLRKGTISLIHHCITVRQCQGNLHISSLSTILILILYWLQVKHGWESVPYNRIFFLVLGHKLQGQSWWPEKLAQLESKNHEGSCQFPGDLAVIIWQVEVTWESGQIVAVPVFQMAHNDNSTSHLHVQR